MDNADLIIIGAGPAGMAAAATAAEGGARVVVLDEQPRPGGQIYRDVGRNGDTRAELGPDYAKGASLVAALDAPGITCIFGAAVWRVEPEGRVIWSKDGQSHISTASHILLATGAQERPVPFPGWTLPGVMSAGATQILMKSAGLLPRDAVLAGSGPLLYLIAAQLIAAGAPPKALVETQTPMMVFRATKHIPPVLKGMSMLMKGLGLLARIKKAGIKRYTSATDFRASQTEAGDITFSFTAKGRAQQITTPLLLTHQGIAPSTQISRALGVDHGWSDAQQAYLPDVQEFGRTNLPNVHIAGDGGGIGGAEAAKTDGQLAALDILRLTGRLSDTAFESAAAPHRKALRQALAIRPFLDAAYFPPHDILAPEGDTMVCRCEEVTAAAIRQSVTEGANGTRQVKTATRAGMGPCQGRMCHLAVDGILATCGEAPKQPRARTPIKPVSLGEMASLAPDQAP